MENPAGRKVRFSTSSVEQPFTDYGVIQVLFKEGMLAGQYFIETEDKGRYFRREKEFEYV